MVTSQPGLARSGVGAALSSTASSKASACGEEEAGKAFAGGAACSGMQNVPARDPKPTFRQEAVPTHLSAGGELQPPAPRAQGPTTQFLHPKTHCHKVLHPYNLLFEFIILLII